MEFLPYIVAVIFTIIIFCAGFNKGIKRGATIASATMLQDLQDSKIIEIVPHEQGHEIYSGFLHRFQKEGIISAALYDFMRSELVKGNLDATKVWIEIMHENDLHAKFLRKMKGDLEDADL